MSSFQLPLAAPPPDAPAPQARLPVHAAFGLDCAGNNPGCSAHRFFSVDVIPSGQFGKGARTSPAKSDIW